MKRFLILFVVLGLLAGSVATAEAKGKKRPIRVERTVEESYGPYPAPVTGCNEALGGEFYCLAVEIRSEESFLTAKVTDVHGQPVIVQVGSLQGHSYPPFCGETIEPLRVYPGDELHFYVAEPIHSGLHCPANRIKTTGTISVTLSNLP